MTSVRASLSASAAVARRDLRLFLSYRLRLVSQLFSTVFGVALFYYVSRLVSVRQFPTHDDYFAFVVVGLAVMEILTATVHTVPATLRSELLSGTFERTVVSPFGPLGGIVALSLFPMAIATRHGDDHDRRCGGAVRPAAALVDRAARGAGSRARPLSHSCRSPSCSPARC